MFYDYFNYFCKYNSFPLIISYFVYIYASSYFLITFVMSLPILYFQKLDSVFIY